MRIFGMGWFGRKNREKDGKYPGMLFKDSSWPILADLVKAANEDANNRKNNNLHSDAFSRWRRKG